MTRWLRFWIGWRGLLLIAGVYLGWQVVVFLRPRPRPVEADEMEAWAMMARTTVHRLKEHLPPGTRLGVAHLSDDPTDRLTRALKAILAETPGWHVEDQPVVQKFVTDVMKAIQEATSLDEILHAGRRVELDAVIVGRALPFSRAGDVTRAAADLAVYDVRRGSLVFRDTIRAEWRPTWVGRLRNAVGQVPVLWRVLIWFALAVGLPWATPFLTHWVIQLKTNVASFALIMGYSVIDVALAMVAAISAPGLGGLAPWIWICLLVVCGMYNVWACERLARSS